MHSNREHGGGDGRLNRGHSAGQHPRLPGGPERWSLAWWVHRKRLGAGRRRAEHARQPGGTGASGGERADHRRLSQRSRSVQPFRAPFAPAMGEHGQRSVSWRCAQRALVQLPQRTHPQLVRQQRHHPRGLGGHVLGLPGGGPAGRQGCSGQDPNCASPFSKARPRTSGPSFVENFGLRAFRRPLTEAEASQYQALFAKGPMLTANTDAFADGVELVVERHVCSRPTSSTGQSWAPTRWPARCRSPTTRSPAACPTGSSTRCPTRRCSPRRPGTS